MHIGIDGSRCGERTSTGVERYALLLLPPLVEELCRRGHRVTVYARTPLSLPLPPALGGPGREPGEKGEAGARRSLGEGGLASAGVAGRQVPRASVHGAPHARLRVIPLPRLWTHVGLGPAAIIDRVDRLFVPTHVLPFLRPRFCAVVLHDACFEEVPHAYRWLDRWYLRLTTADALRSARVITHSAASSQAFVSFYHARRDRIAVIPPAVLPMRGDAPTVPWPTPYLLFLGRIERKKNLAILLRAFDTLMTKRRELPHHLVLLGKDGFGSESIRLLHRSLTTHARIHFQGYVDDTLRDMALRAARGLVLPSICEGFSFVLLEARAARLPFASSGCAACREVGGPEAVYVEDPTRIDAWVTALASLIDRPRIPAALPERTWEDVAGEVADILTE